MRSRLVLMSAAAAALCGPAQASLTISAQPTHNVTCSAHTCSTSSKRATLNVNDLTSLLATSDVRIISGRRTQDIVVLTPVGWASSQKLTFSSSHSVLINKPILVNGPGSVTITTDSSGTYAFGPQGNITFLDASSGLSLNQVTYKLAGDLATLAADVSADPISNYALMNDYNAGPDGIYSSSPVPILNAKFEGLGHTITNLKIKSTAAGTDVGLFSQVSGVAHLHFVKAHVNSSGEDTNAGVAGGNCSGTFSDVSISRSSVSGNANSYVGGICGILGPGSVTNVHASGMVTGRGNLGTTHNAAGGLAGELAGVQLSASDSAVNVTGAKHWTVGGLGGLIVGAYIINGACATGTVIVGDDGVAGGLLGFNDVQEVANAYATGSVIGGVGSTVGGLVGIDTGIIAVSYSTGAVASGSGTAVGGLVGAATGMNADLSNTYWDTETSGQSHGVGNDTAFPGVTGLTTAQFHAGLPSGFSPDIWAEDAAINGGFPYLIALPPG